METQVENPAHDELRPVVTPDELKDVLEPISISRIGTFASCQTKGYIRYRLKEKAPFTAPHFFVGGTLHKAIEDYYQKKFTSVLDGALWHLRDEFRKHKIEDKFEAALKAAEIEADILDQFSNGTIRRPDGSLYSSPKMTKVYKEMATAKGLWAAQSKLKDAVLGDVRADGGLQEVITRVLLLAERYQNTLLVPREDFNWLETERGFDFVVTAPSGRKIRFLGFLDLYGLLKSPNKQGKSHVLIDYKSGKAHDADEHQMSSHASLQLTLYWFVLTQLWGIPEADLDIALHYLDAAYEARTSRTMADWNRLLMLADGYDSVCNSPGLPKRLFYDGMDCSNCEMRDNCIKHFGLPTTASEEFARALAAK